MILGGEFSEKLTHLMTATAIYCATATVAPGLGVDPSVGVLGLVEAVLGGTAVAHMLLRRRTESFVAVARRCTRKVNDGSDGWIEDEFKGIPDAQAKRDAAIAAIRTVLPLIAPRAEELVAARLTEVRVAAYYLDRAAKERPFDFADVISNDADDMARRAISRRLFTAIVTKAYGVIARQPEFAAEILRQTLAELLQGQDVLQGKTEEVLRGQLDAAERLARIEALLTQHIGAPPALAERAAAEVFAAAAEDRRLAEALDCMEHGDIAAAEALFRTVAEEKATRIQRDRRDAAAAYRNLGAIAGMGDPKRALDAYAKAVEFDNEDKESLLWLAWLSFERGALNEAEQNYRRVLLLVDGDDEAWFSLSARIGIGDVQGAQGDLAAALTSYRASLAIRERLAAADPGMPAGSATSRSRTTRSATCRASRAISRRR
jgi:tetratricopeptide (TPR) repeat protein